MSFNMRICKRISHIRIINMTVNEISEKLRKYLEDNDITEEILAKKANVDQSQVSRIRNAQFKRITENVMRVCKYAEIDLGSIREESDPAKNPELMGALSLVWDGTDKKAKALAKVIRSLKELS